MTKTVDAKSLKAMLNDGAELALLDMREEGEFGLFARRIGGELRARFVKKKVRYESNTLRIPFVCGNTRVARRAGGGKGKVKGGTRFRVDAHASPGKTKRRARSGAEPGGAR